MTQLTDIQILLLAAAAERDDASLLPPPETLVTQRSTIRKALVALLGSALAAEVKVSDEAKTWRRIGGERIGLVITDAGCAALARSDIATSPAAKPSRKQRSKQRTLSPAPAEAAQSKSAMVLDLLRREDGVTLDEIVSATGWLPHSVRAALTGLRKKGHAIKKAKRGDLTCYRLSTSA